ncbi:hypothetical protein OAY_05720 [Vibrio cyclitrophicus ZF205]|uniref:DUF6701 domain-containing protein n=1 Tax=Vibrio cyclitrophicus TaxID=47951 RepID=UPI0002FC90AF|nr:DUF6701 domain-containing protein [Vibrio cyclitrophicus]OEE15581.1 hypothetical protein OAY_05720 [Vibrio cyclitrophicus ZF205]
MIKHFSVLLVALFLSPLVQANVNTNPQFEFGTVPADKCDISGPTVECVIEFENTYDSAPLVFVMSTVNASRSNFDSKTTEYPSDLRVWSVSSSQATIKQLLPPHDAACVRLKQNNNGQWRCSTNTNDPLVEYVDAPMENIDYLVIEPGVLEFDSGAKLVAGTIDYNRTYSNAGGGANNSKSVQFSDFGLSSNFSSSPGVLVQIQSLSNMQGSAPVWLTPIALNPTTSTFNLVLDRSEVSSNAQLASNEQVAFVAGLGEGFINGQKFWLGQGSTSNTLNIDDRVIKPITEGCQLVQNFSASGFSGIPTLLASKRTRNGNNGGWLRRCSVSTTGVALINEEDMARDDERAHVVEPYSYFLFDKPPTSEICQLFPSPVQTWQGNSNAEIAFWTNNGHSSIEGAPLSGGKRYIGFEQSDINEWSTVDTACDNTECFGDAGLLVNKQELESFQAPDSGLENISVWDDDIEFSNNESIGKLTLGNGSVTFYSGTYWIESINVNNKGRIIIPDGQKVILHFKALSLTNSAFLGEEGSGQLIALVHDLEGSNVDFNSDSEFKGLIYSEVQVALSNQATVYGAVTAKSITMNGTARIIATDNHCFQPSDDYEIEISPATDLALMCGDDSPQFTINTSNNGVGKSLGVTVGITPDADEFDVSLLKGSGAYPNYASNNDGELTIQVTAKSTSSIDFDTSYKLTAILVEDSDKEVESQFKFVPFKFSLVNGDSPTNRLDVIAGQATPTVTKVLACDLGDSIVVAENYVGEAEKQVTITHELDNSWNGSDGTLTYLPEFKKGSAATDLTISESGLFNVTLKDSSFDCTGFAGCPDDGSYDLEGSFSIYSRPWQFAICTDNNSDGNSSGGDAFVAAGEEFDVFAKPIRFTNDASQLCNNNLVTQNYLLSSGAIGANHTLDTPSNGDAVLGSLEPSSQLTQSSSDIVSSDNGYKFKSLKYSEVGSINFKVTENSNSFYGKILGGLSGNKNIGRFYPDYLSLISNRWNYSSGHDNFAYMAQGISFNFIVEARNRDNEPVTNYGLFAGSLKASIKHVAIEEDGTVLNTRVWLSGGKDADHISWGEDDWSSARLTIENFYYEFLRLASEDGPYDNTNSEFGVWVSDKVDGVDLQFLDLDNTNTDYTNGTKFSFQPDFRYGRMSLKDVGGNQGRKIQVPLEVQYWSGSKFEINSDDSGSQFNGSDYCVTKIWDDAEPTDAKLTSDIDDDGNDDTVSVLNGISSNLIAKQETSRREQVRLFLRQGSSPSGATCFGSEGAQPWLQYNWRGLGDEDPSTVVTFGIYRGNDRVIYRGESGLTGQ